MLKISPSKSITLATLRLEGKLIGPWVDELRAVVARLHGPKSVRLDLTHLGYADSRGVELLQEFSRGGVDLVGASALIAELLTPARQVSSGDGAAPIPDLSSRE